MALHGDSRDIYGNPWEPAEALALDEGFVTHPLVTSEEHDTTMEARERDRALLAALEEEHYAYETHLEEEAYKRFKAKEGAVYSTRGIFEQGVVFTFGNDVELIHAARGGYVTGFEMIDGGLRVTEIDGSYAPQGGRPTVQSTTENFSRVVEAAPQGARLSINLDFSPNPAQRAREEATVREMVGVAERAHRSGKRLRLAVPTGNASAEFTEEICDRVEEMGGDCIVPSGGAINVMRLLDQTHDAQAEEDSIKMPTLAPVAVPMVSAPAEPTPEEVARAEVDELDITLPTLDEPADSSGTTDTVDARDDGITLREPGVLASLEPGVYTLNELEALEKEEFETAEAEESTAEEVAMLEGAQNIAEELAQPAAETAEAEHDATAEEELEVGEEGAMNIAQLLAEKEPAVATPKIENAIKGLQGLWGAEAAVAGLGGMKAPSFPTTPAMAAKRARTATPAFA